MEPARNAADTLTQANFTICHSGKAFALRMSVKNGLKSKFKMEHALTARSTLILTREAWSASQMNAALIKY